MASLLRRVVVLSCRDGVQSEEVAKLNTGSDAGYRLLLHPSGRALVSGGGPQGGTACAPAARAAARPGRPGRPGATGVSTQARQRTALCSRIPCSHGARVVCPGGCHRRPPVPAVPCGQVCGMSVGGLERVDLQPGAAGEPPRLSLSQGAGAREAGPVCSCCPRAPKLGLGAAAVQPCSHHAPAGSPHGACTPALQASSRMPPPALAQSRACLSAATAACWRWAARTAASRCGSGPTCDGGSGEQPIPARRRDHRPHRCCCMCDARQHLARPGRPLAHRARCCRSRLVWEGP